MLLTKRQAFLKNMLAKKWTKRRVFSKHVRLNVDKKSSLSQKYARQNIDEKSSVFKKYTRQNIDEKSSVFKKYTRQNIDEKSSVFKKYTRRMRGPPGGTRRVPMAGGGVGRSTDTTVDMGGPVSRGRATGGGRVESSRQMLRPAGGVRRDSNKLNERAE
jgi:hypothetical protein